MEKLFEEFGIEPNNWDYYELAFTHSTYSVAHDLPSNYERLEFLGDAVLEMEVSRYLYDHYPNVEEGKLTKLRANYVCQQALIFYSHRYGLDEYIKISTENKGMTDNEILSVTADVFEAFLGALYLDQGIDVVNDFLKQTVFKHIHTKRVFFNDYKSPLKEWCDINEADIEYNILKEYGAPHDKTFIIEVLINGEKLGVGKGKNKKEAEQNASKLALESLGELE